MARLVNDPVERLRAARPPETDVDPDAFDAELLERVRGGPAPTGRRRPPSRRRFTLPAAVVLTAAAVAAVLLLLAGGTPGLRGSGPASAEAAVRQALRWFDPAPGTILHVRSELTSVAPDGRRFTTEQELWQSVDRPERQRHVERADAIAVEAVLGDVYDPATDTIYEETAPGPRQRAALRQAIAKKIAAARDQGATTEQLRRMREDAREALRGMPDHSGGEPAALGDPTVVRIRMLLDRGEATLGAETTHDGVRAHPITLHDGPRGDGDPRWTLWTAAADGRPLELRIDRGEGTKVLERTRWTSYEVVPGTAADRLLTLAGAHPDARVVRDPDAYEAAMSRLYPRG